jgi:hypothetical protein
LISAHLILRRPEVRSRGNEKREGKGEEKRGRLKKESSLIITIFTEKYLLEICKTCDSLDNNNFY